MTAKKQDYKVGDIVRSEEETFEIKSITREPTAIIFNLDGGDEETITFSELATFAHYPLQPKIGRPPKTRKAEPVVVEAVRITDPKISGTENNSEQASTPETVPLTPTKPSEEQKQAQESMAPTYLPRLPGVIGDILEMESKHPQKVDLSTFVLRVGHDKVQHRMSLMGETFTKGGDLKQTLLDLLKRYGITAESNALLTSKLVLEYPESEGRNLILKILKEGS